jgi:hypothetical protein
MMDTKLTGIGGTVAAGAATIATVRGTGLEAAEAATQAIETLNPGEAFAGPLQEARRAHSDRRTAIRSQVIRPFVIGNSDVIQTLQFVTQGWPRLGYGASAARLFETALAAGETRMTDFLQAEPFVTFVGEMAAAAEPEVTASAQARAREAAILAYEEAIARALAAHGDVAAEALGITLPALRARVDQAERRHREHAAAEAARIAAENAEIERINREADERDVDGAKRRAEEAEQAKRLVAWEARKAKCEELAQWFDKAKNDTARDAAGRAYAASGIATLLRSGSVSDEGIKRFEAMKADTEAGRVPAGPKW